MIDTSQTMTEVDINEALIKLDYKKLKCYNECCPIKTRIIPSRGQIKSWVNQALKNNILKRQNIYKLYQQGLILEREYNNFRNFVNNKIRMNKQKK